MRKIGNILFAALILLTACTQQKQEDNGAELLYNEAKAAFEAGNTNRSKLLIDSIHSAYRMNVGVRKQAANLMLEIKAFEEARTQAYLDSLRPIREAEFDALKKNFRMSGDTAYYNYKKYIHKNQFNDAPRISLIAEVKDDGELQLISAYMGKALDHKRVRVENKDKFFVETLELSLDSPYNNRFDDFGTRWEYLTFIGDNLGDLASFIASNYDKQLKVTLYADSVETKKGMKAVTYSYNLDPQDRVAIAQAVELANVLKDLNKMK